MIARRIEALHWALIAVVVVVAIVGDPLVHYARHWGDKAVRFVQKLGFHIHDWVLLRVRR